MKNNIRCAVFGVGRLGLLHAKNVAHRIQGAELVYVVASRPERAREAAEKLGIPNWTTDPDTVFQDETIDAVIIVTPTNTHYELIKKAVQYKKQIFVDKPITETVEQAKEVMELIQTNNIHCMVGFMRRFDPAYIEAKKRIQAGDIGTPLYFKGVSRDPGSPPEEVIKNSGGIFLDLCIHDFDIARYLLDSEVKSITSVGAVHVHPFMKKYRDVDQAISYLTFENGAAADIEGSRNSTFGYDIRGEVVGTEGSIQIGTLRKENVTLLNHTGTTFENIPAFQAKFENAFLIEMNHFINCLRNDEKPLVNEIDGLASLQVAAAATEAFHLNRNVTIG